MKQKHLSKILLKANRSPFYSDMAQQNVCRFYKFGFCKYKDNCRNMHIHDKCDNRSCEMKNCSLRHPRKCSFYRDYKRCKQAQLGVPHSRIQVELNFILQAETCRILNFAQNLRQSKAGGVNRDTAHQNRLPVQITSLVDAWLGGWLVQ